VFADDLLESFIGAFDESAAVLIPGFRRAVVGVRLRETGSSWELVSLGRPNAVPLEVGIVLV